MIRDKYTPTPALDDESIISCDGDASASGADAPAPVDNDLAVVNDPSSSSRCCRDYSRRWCYIQCSSQGAKKYFGRA